MPKKSTARKRKAPKAAAKSKAEKEEIEEPEQPKEEEESEQTEDVAKNGEDASAAAAEAENGSAGEAKDEDADDDGDINPPPSKMAKTENNEGPTDVTNGSSEKPPQTTTEAVEVAIKVKTDPAETEKKPSPSSDPPINGEANKTEAPKDSPAETVPDDPPSTKADPEPTEGPTNGALLTTVVAPIPENPGNNPVAPSIQAGNPGPSDNPGNNPSNNPGTNPGPTSNPGTTMAPPNNVAAPPAVTATPVVPAGVPTLNTPAMPVAPPPSMVPPVTVAPPPIAAIPSTPQQPQQNLEEVALEEKGEVSTLYVGRVIGKGGEMIRDLQARSGCRIDVDQNVPEGHPRIITYRGSRSTIDFAKQLVALLCTERGKEAELPLGKAIRKQILVPSTVIGKIIGRGGEMIRELQSKSQAKIQVDHTGGGGIDASQRQVTVTGTEQSVVKAEEMIMFLCANPAMDAMQAISMLIKDKTQGGVWGSGPPYPNMPNQGQGMPGANDMGSGMGGGMYGGGGGYGGQPNMGYGGYGGHAQQGGGYGQQQYGQPGGGGGGNVGAGMIESELFPCAKQYMGRVIGQKGVTINDLQKRSGCDIQINQNVPMGHDCEISIKGTRQGIDMAKQMLQEIIEMGPNHPYAGGHGQFGGGNQFGRQQNYQPQQYQQGGYSPQGYQPQSYPPQYGMQQQYGGQPMYQPQQPPFQPQQAPPFGAQPGMPAPYGAPPPAQASPWRTATAADGQIYYYNEKTGETQWDKPAGMP